MSHFLLLEAWNRYPPASRPQSHPTRPLLPFTTPLLTLVAIHLRPYLLPQHPVSLAASRLEVSSSISWALLQQVCTFLRTALLFWPGK